jgi:hypothetical protein
MHNTPATPTEKRQLWEVWRERGMWMVQGPRARVDFFSRKVAQDFANRNRALEAAKAASEARAEFLSIRILEQEAT